MSASPKERRRRAERARAAQALAAKGASWETIGRVLRISRSTVAAYLSDPDGTKLQRRRKRQRRQRPIVTEDDGKNWTREEIVEALKSWFLTYGEAPAIRDWNPHGYAERQARHRRLRRSGLVPHARTVLALFGTWNAALEAAGLPTRKPGGQEAPTSLVCPQGHELTEDNFFIDRGRRRCRTCVRLYKKDWTTRKKARERGLLID